ncbi:48_t:CDS:2 [Entrophospora sp. SA101]|nr:48_t:CDS:2 [Entrophospora sp. SA101]
MNNSIPVRPLVVYYNSQINAPFEEFFQRFWENSILGATSANTSEIGEYKGYLEEKKAVEEFEKKRQETLKAERHNFKKIEGFYTDNTWYTTFAQELLRALKEDLIKELVIISSLRKGLDFAIGALEYRTNKLEQAIKALKQQNRPSSPTPT